MNRNLYRVIFNSARGLLMVVQETASGLCKGSRANSAVRCPASDRRRVYTMLPMRGIAFAAFCVFGTQPAFVRAQVVAAPNASPAGKPAVGAAANGIPLVQITTPNAAGVSNNTYTQYNVGTQGLILNNSPGTVQTKLGGYVQGNPYLATGGARIIVNQVVGGSPSQLLGYTEVAGQRAEVVIANPAGLYCNGCGFINTTRGVLTTGTPVFGGSGSLDAFHVTGGQIQIGAAGLNGSDVDQVDLIARSVKVNGKIWAGRQLDVVTGANDVDHADLRTQAVTPDADVPGVAIDVSQLGGMYAGKIRLVGTEAGVGVNSLGTIQAQAGDIQLSNAGKVTLAGSTSASGNVQIQAAGDVANSGILYATQNLSVSSRGQVVNSGTLASLESTEVSGSGVSSTGALGAGIDADGHLSGSGNLVVTATGTASATGQNLAAGNLTMSGSSLDLSGAQTLATGSMALTATGASGDTGNVTLAHATTTGGGRLNISAAGALINDQAHTSAGQLTVTAASLSNRSGLLVQTGTDAATVAVTGNVDNTQGTLQAGGAASLTAANVTNTAGRIVSLNGDGLTLDASGQITNTAGTTAQGAAGGVIGGNGNVTVRGASLTNTGTVTAGQTLKETVGGLLDNSMGTMTGAAVTANAGSLKNARGTISGSTVSLTIPQLDNSGGQITTNQLSVSATNLTNEGGTLTQLGMGPMSMMVTNALDNSNGGVLQTNSQDLTLAPASLNNNGGTITHAGTGALTIDVANGTGSLTNTSGKITSNGQANVSAGALDNVGGTMASHGVMTITVAGTLNNNAGGTLHSDTSLSGTIGASLSNVGGRVNAGTSAGASNPSTLSLRAASIDNTNGSIIDVGSGATTLSATGQIVNSNAGGVSGMGRIGGNGNVTLTATALSNTSGGQLSGANLQLNAGSLNNTGGQIGNVANSNGDIGISTSGVVYNGSGQISAARNLSLTANTLAGGGEYDAANNATLNLQGSFTNAPGYQFNAGNNLTFNLPGTFSNGGSLVTFGNLQINAGDITNSGAIDAGGLLSTNSATVDNTGSLVGGSVSLKASQAIRNLGTTALIGATDSSGILELLAPDIENRDDTTISDTPAQTSIYGLGRVALAGGRDANGNYVNASLIRNQSALIQSSGDMTIAANQVTNTRRVVTTTGFTSSVDPALLERQGISLSGCTAVYMQACAGEDVAWVDKVNPGQIGGQFTEPPHGGQWNSGYQYTTYTGTAIANTVASISPGSQIIAGGNLNASSVGTFQNYWSQVAATGNIAAPTSLDQDSWRGQSAPKVQVTYSGKYHYNNYDNTEHNWTMPFGTGASNSAPADVHTYALPSYESSWTANGTIRGTGVAINNTAGNAGVTPLGLAPGQSLTGTSANLGQGSVASGGNIVSGESPTTAIVRGNPGEGVRLSTGSDGTSPVSGKVGGSGAATSGAASTAGPVMGGVSVPDGDSSKATALPVLSNLTVPQGGLFKPDTAPNAPYLVETNPAFTNLHQWLSSDYYFQQMGMDPSRIQKRLGDGFYEQHLVQSQIMSLTGKAVLTNYADTQSEFESLMASGATLAKSLNLAVGMGLSAEQVAHLTSNVVLMQARVVDGKSVLVPVVYLAQASREDMGNGPVIAATDIDIEDAQRTTNSGTIRATNSLTLAGQSIDSTNGTLQSGGRMTLATTGDVNLTSGTLKAGSLALKSGGNLILDTAVKTLDQISDTGATRVTSTLGPTASISVGKDALISVAGNFDQKAASLSVGGDLTATVLGNWTLDTAQTGEHKVVERANGVSDTNLMQGVGSEVSVGGTSKIGIGGDLTARGATIDLGGGGTIAAAGNVSLLAATTTSTMHSSSATTDGSRHSADDIRTSDDVVRGTTLESGQSLVVEAGKDMTITGSAVDLKKGTAILAAAGDVNIGSAVETHFSDVYESGSHSGFGSKASKVDHVVQTTQTADGSTISADSVGIVSGKNVTVQGSSVVATNDVALQAKGNVDIVAAHDTYQDSELHDLKHSGFTGTGGIGFGYGSSEQKDQYDATSITQSQSRSTVGSVAGNVSIVAGSNVHVGGSDIIAGKASNDTKGATGNVSVQAQNITIDPGRDDEHSHDQQDAHSSGFSVAVTGTPVDSARNLRQAGSSGNGFQRLEGVSNELLASAFDMPSVSMSFSHSSSSSTTDIASQTNVGSTVRGGGNVALIATGGAKSDAHGNPIDGDILLTGSAITAGGIASLSANRDVVLQASTDQLQQSMQSSSSSSGFSLATPSPGDPIRWVTGGPNSGGIGPSPYNASRSNSNGDSAATHQTASAVSGNSVVMTSKTGDIDVIGSGISGMQGVDMVAGQGAINVLAGTDTSRSHQESSSRQIGDLGSNGTGTGFSVGISKTHMTQDVAAQTQSTIRGQIVSADGNVSLKAKQDLTVQGSDLSAGKDLTLVAENVKLDAGTDAMQSSMSQSASQFGVTVTVGGALGNAAATINQSMAAARHTDNQRLAKLDEAQAALSAYGAYQAIDLSKTSKNAPSLVKVTASIGGGTSHSQSESNSVTNDGSTLEAGHNVTIVATGSGAKDSDGKASDGNITARGTKITGENVELNAAQDIDLESAKDTNHQAGSNSSSGGGIGVGFSFGGQQNGFTVELAANGSKGHMNGDGTTNHDTRVTASQTLSMTSGRDTNLRGAEVSGSTVDANVGRDLNIASPQNTSAYSSKQTSAGVQLSVCVPPICWGAPGASGSMSFNQQNIKDDYKSVGQQSGIFAGAGGFDVYVGSRTQLDGGVIASEADPSKNTLSTQTLGFSNLENSSKYSGTSFGYTASGGFSSKAPAGKGSADAGQSQSTQSTTQVVQTPSSVPGPTTSTGLGPTGAGVAGTRSSQSGTTYAAVSPGTITVRGDAGTGRDSTAGLSRDAAHANDGALTNKFDAQKVGDDLAIQTQTEQVGMQVVGDVGTYLKKKADDNYKDAKERLADAKDPEAQAQAKADMDSASMQEKLWGDDGAARIGLHAVAAGLGAATGGGNVLGSVAGTISGDEAVAAVSPALDGTLGSTILKNVVSGAAGAVVGGMVGGASGAVSGANGALGADLYNRQLHPDEKKKLADLQKGKSADEQHKLAAAECALTRCAAGVPDNDPDNDPDKAALTKLQNEGQSYTDQQRQLKDAGAFDGYGWADTVVDLNDRDHLTTRAGGAVQGVTGAAVAATVAGAGCSTGVACALALTGAATSLDWSLAGFKTAVNGDPTSTYGEQVLQGLGMSPSGAALTYGLVNVGAAGGSALVDGVGSTGNTSSSAGRSGSTGDVTTSGGTGKNWTGGGAQLGDDSQFLLGERQLPTARGSLTGDPEAPPPNASADQVRSIQRQNEAAQVLADHGLDVEQLPNTGKGSNPDLEINGQKADVYSPTTKNPQTIWGNVKDKVAGQAANVVLNLADSPLSASDMAQYFQRNPVPGMNTITLIKNGVVTVLGR